MLIVRKKAVIPFTAVKIRLTKNMFAYISLEDEQLVKRYYWRAVKSFSKYYARSRKVINGKVTTIRMHRLITHCQAWEKVHHINHNTLDNRRENLQVMCEFEFRKIDGAHVFEH